MKRILVCMMVLAMVLSLMACAKPAQTAPAAAEPAAAPSAAGPAATDKSWDEIKEKGYFLVNRNDAYLPMTFRNEKNENVGFDVDLANAVGKYLGVEARVFLSDWDSKLIVLNGRDADVIWCGFTVTEERKTQVLFTDPYIANTQYIVVMADSPIKSKADLEGKTMGWQLGSSCEGVIKADPIYPKLAGERTYVNMTEPMMDMTAGRIDAVVLDSLYYGYWSTEQGVADKYRVLDDNFGNEYMAVGTRLEDHAWHDKLNEALMAVINSDEGVAISMKWFGFNVFEALPGYGK